MSGPGTSRDETVDAVVPLREDHLEIIERQKVINMGASSSIFYFIIDKAHRHKYQVGSLMCFLVLIFPFWELLMSPYVDTSTPEARTGKTR